MAESTICWFTRPLFLPSVISKVMRQRLIRSHWSRTCAMLLPPRLLLGSGLMAPSSPDQSRDQGTEQGSASAPGVVHELEEAEIQRQLLLRDALVRAEPGLYGGPNPGHRGGGNAGHRGGRWPAFVSGEEP